MEAKQIQWIITGMQRDVSPSKFSPKHSYENFNIRLTAREDSTLLSITNEKGTKQHTITGLTGSTISGTYLGQGMINNIMVIFTKDDTNDKIYRLIYDTVDNSFEGEIYYEGQLGFDREYPIETISVYENEDIQKVYFVDGLNQPRMINVSLSMDSTKFSDTFFDFVATLQLKETVSVLRDSRAVGNFAPGTIQYAFTYFNTYGQESNIFYTTPLRYISFNERGASPEDKVSNSFNIQVQDLDTSFDYLRIYSIHRTSLEATPTVLKVVDLFIDDGTTSLSYMDSGITGSTIDPAQFLFIGGETIVAGTLTHKDNTLFLGDITLSRKTVPSSVRDALEGGTITWSVNNPNRAFEIPTSKNYYSYDNSLNSGHEFISTFKYLDWYRFGIQFQHYTGKWSETLWVNDDQNTRPVRTELVENVLYPALSQIRIKLTQASYTFSNNAQIELLVEQGYIRARGVICFPTLTDREVVAQGVLAPTVYNVQDRAGNSPFSQSSWFFRPNSPFDYTAAMAGSGDWADWYNPSIDSINSKAGMWTNDVVVQGDLVNEGAWAEFRHNYPIPDNHQRNAEIQCIMNPPDNPYTDGFTAAELTLYTSSNAEYFYVDQSIVTFHSPDIEFDDRVRDLATSNLKLRIVGMAPFSANASDLDIITSTQQNSYVKRPQTKPIGFYKELIGSQNLSQFGWRGMLTGAFWLDELSNYKSTGMNEDMNTFGFMVYPWHRSGSLNNYGVPLADATRSAMLDKKKMSNLRYSFNSYYYYASDVWYAQIDDVEHYEYLEKRGISGVTIFDSDQVSMIKVPAPQNSPLSDINYYGNVDKLVNVGMTTPEKKLGYPIVTTGFYKIEADSAGGYHTLFSGDPISVDNEANPFVISELTNDTYGTEPVHMKYKSTAHAVIALNYTINATQAGSAQRVLPTVTEIDGHILRHANPVQSPPTGNRPFWDKDTHVISQDVISAPYIVEPPSILGGSNGRLRYGFLWLAELYNDTITNRFGGQTQEAFENNLWLPGGEPVSLLDEEGFSKSSITVDYTLGDTFYQRYDCLKTYPFTLEDTNSVVDIASFMCETRINMDGRYDRNRGQISNLVMTPENFNKMNPVYSQSDNFFNYKTLNYNRFSLDTFPNTVTWSKSKTSGDLIDTWTNINVVSVLDMDGDKGNVVALRRFNNEIFCFQETGVSRILFNSRVQVPTSDGTPIEISNNYKVDGKIYVSEDIGCKNKWSIVTTQQGIYFIDNNTDSIYIFNGQNIENVSDAYGFRTFLQDNNSAEVWDSFNFDNFISFKDKKNRDIYFINSEYCLGYSEILKQFTSFYSYEKVPLMFNNGSRWFSLKDGKIWEHGAGHYNLFYDEIKPYSITLIANPDIDKDKTFSTVQFKADSYMGDTYLPNETFNHFSIWNEYQEGSVDLNTRRGYPSSLKKKFRYWNINIPRDRANFRDRIRNPWAFIKLENTDPGVYKTQLHDVVLQYFI